MARNRGQQPHVQGDRLLAMHQVPYTEVGPRHILGNHERLKPMAPLRVDVLVDQG
jgi:hypothetical protein